MTLPPTPHPCNAICSGSITPHSHYFCTQSFVDRSDPDTVLPNMIHMLQTAERARSAGMPDWFQVTALIHDMVRLRRSGLVAA